MREGGARKAGVLPCSREVRMRTRCCFLGAISVVVVVLAGCGNCSDEIAEANQFLAEPANLACQSKEDCAVVSTGCADVSRAFCGQASLNREAAASKKWQQISNGLTECDSSCAQCGALLVPTCSQGSCGDAR